MNKESSYKDFFNSPYWIKLIEDTTKTLERESVITVGIASCGKRLFLKTIQQEFRNITQKKETIIISFELIDSNLTTEYIDKKILDELKNFVKNKVSTAKQGIETLLNKDKDVIIIINMCELLADKPECINYLEEIRSIDPLKVRFLLGCDLSCIVNPMRYKSNGTLFSSNLTYLRSFTKEETVSLLETYQKIFGWNTFGNETLVYELSGGIPGLIKYIVKYLQDLKNDMDLATIAQNNVINIKMSQIWEDLIKYDLLKSNNSINLQHLHILNSLNLIDSDQSFISTILNNYINNKKLDNFKEDLLTAQEYKVFKLLEKNIDEIVSLDDISRVIWENSSNQNFSLDAIYKTISNLNLKIKEQGMEIISKRARGYILSSRK